MGVSLKILNRHIYRKHNTAEHRKCPFCDYKAPDMTGYHVHIDRYHRDIGGDKNFSCDKCSARFIYENSLRYHKHFKCTKFIGNVSHPQSFTKRKERKNKE